MRGRKLEEFSKNPENLKQLTAKIRAQQKACTIAAVNLSDSCFFSAIPEHQLISWLSERERCMNSAYQEINSEPSDYEILHKCHVVTSTILKEPILYKNQLKKIKYDIFGSATGRLTTVPGSFPILNMKKEERQHIRPLNHALVELDFNAAEIRTLLALSGQAQPAGDIHNWLLEEAYDGSISREEVKKGVFSWLYNFSASDPRLSKFFSREIFRDFYNLENQTLKTPYNRILSVEERKAQNYLLQSTTSDIVMENSYNIMKFLKTRRSKLAFTMHDSVVLDFHRDDLKLLKDIKRIFESTRWGKFMSTCKVGKNFGKMKDLKI